MFDTEAIVAVFDRVLLNPLLLAQAFTELPHVTNSHVAFMYSLVPGRPGLIGDGVAGEMQRVYAEQGWKGADVITALAPTLAINDVHLSDDFLPGQTLATQRFFEDYLSRWNIVRGAGWWFDLDGEPWVFALARNAGQPPFSAGEKAALGRASARISSAMTSLNRLATGRTMAICETLDMVGSPYVLIDHRGWVDRATPAAAAMFDAHFDIQDAALRATDPNAGEQLQNVAAMARCGSLGTRIAGIEPPRTIVIPRGDGRQPVVARPLRLRRELYDVLPGIQIVLRLDDLEQRTLPSAELLQAIFDLTPREVAVARCMAAGQPSRDICKELKLTTGYLQQLVNAIFLKTHTHSRQELVALLARVPDQA
jgi:DNA-binding CsgD family transcriptional regulator